MRIGTRWIILIVLAMVAVPAHARSGDNDTPDQEKIAELEARISQAPVKEQCFLYAKLIHQMTDLSLQQYSAGHVDTANQLLKQIQKFASKLRLTVADNNKRLKNAEILLRNAAYRLNDMLNASSFEDRQLVEQTLAQVKQADNAAMMQVFRK